MLDGISLVAIMTNLACVFCDKKTSKKPVELRACVCIYVCVPTFGKKIAKKKGHLSEHRRLHVSKSCQNGDSPS